MQVTLGEQLTDNRVEHNNGVTTVYGVWNQCQRALPDGTGCEWVGFDLLLAYQKAAQTGHQDAFVQAMADFLNFLRTEPGLQRTTFGTDTFADRIIAMVRSCSYTGFGNTEVQVCATTEF